MSKNLLIVESPAKAKTIEKILGKDFQVNSCYGHIRDLEKAGMGIDVENDFHPRYIIPDDKKKVVNELKSLAKNLMKCGLQLTKTVREKQLAGICVRCWG